MKKPLQGQTLQGPFVGWGTLGDYLSHGPRWCWGRFGQNNKIITKRLGVHASSAPSHIACRVLIYKTSLFHAYG